MAKLTSSYTIKTAKNGTVTVVKKPGRKNVSQRIAEKKNPKRRLRRGKRLGAVDG